MSGAAAGVAPVQPAGAVRRDGARLQSAAHGSFGALAQVMRCSVCARGFVPAPPAPRVCDACGAVASLPSYLDVPTHFRRWLVERVLVRRLESGITRQVLFSDLVRSAALGRLPHDRCRYDFVPTYTTPAGELYRYLLLEYVPWLDAGAPDLLWEAPAP